MKSVLERYEEVEQYLKRGSDIDDRRASKGHFTTIQHPIASRNINISDKWYNARLSIHSSGEGVGISARELVEGFDNYSVSLNYDMSAEDGARQRDSTLSTNITFFARRHSRSERIKASSGSGSSSRNEPVLTVSEDTCACWLRQLTTSVPALHPVCAHMTLRTYKRCFSYSADQESVA